MTTSEVVVYICDRVFESGAWGKRRFRDTDNRLEGLEGEMD